MAIQTRNVTVTINDVNGDLVENARVEIKLRGLGNGPNGAVAPNKVEQYTNENGQTIFKLWENRQDYSDTYYEVSSYHPDGYSIHRREIFRVYDSDANLAELIAAGLVAIDPTQALADQVAADRAAAANSASQAAISAADAESAKDDSESAKDLAEFFKGQAQESASNAELSASLASSSEQSAEQSKLDAQASAAAAASSEANATASENTAVAAKNDAQLAASQAEGSYNSARQSELNAAASEDAAANHESGALGYYNSARAEYQAAEIEAGKAAASAIEAAGHESNAQGYATNAQNSADIAADHTAQAEGHADRAENAETGAVAAKNAAEAAAASVNNIHNGDGAPSDSLGDNDDYYIDNQSSELYGPKTAGTWGTPVSLVGPEGPEGPQGPAGTGSGDVNGPATSAVGALAVFGNASGDLLAEGPLPSEFVKHTDKVTDQIDTTVGKILTTGGWMGWGKTLRLTSSYDLFDLPISGVANLICDWVSASVPSNLPAGVSNGLGFYSQEGAARSYWRVVDLDTGKTHEAFRQSGSWSTWSDAVDKSELSQVAFSGDYSDLSGKPSLGSLAEKSSVNNSDWSGTDLAIGNGGTGASNAADARSNLGLGSAATASSSSFATASQGNKADTAVQPGDLSAVATSGSYADLSGRPTLGALASKSTVSNSDWSGTDLAVANGGTGSSNASGARTNLGLGSVATRTAVSGPTDSTSNRMVDNARLAEALSEVGGGGSTYPVVDTGIRNGTGSIPSGNWVDVAPSTSPGPHKRYTFNFDCSSHNYWMGYTTEGQLIQGTTPSYALEHEVVFNLQNLPNPASSAGFIGFIEWRNLLANSSRASAYPVFTVPSGWTVEWSAGSMPALGSENNECDVLQLKAWPGSMTVVVSVVGVYRP
ncbi:hypothetical protein [Gilvimarinus chinensis]|uniref:hypothetical protein n=1 Tax=Gilvimarinus chinensis TaxID=396005 RepID=UPI00035D76CB|nr:hypothetical protein [Gilvimarinus chinensis]